MKMPITMMEVDVSILSTLTTNNTSILNSSLTMQIELFPVLTNLISKQNLDFP